MIYKFSHNHLERYTSFVSIHDFSWGEIVWRNREQATSRGVVLANHYEKSAGRNNLCVGTIAAKASESCAFKIVRGHFGRQ